MPRPSWGIWLTTAIWIAVAGGLWARHDYQLRNGREISLEAMPVDQRDILRGDYVALRYEISTVEREEGDTSPWPFREDQIVYVSLEESDDGWAIHALDRNPPDGGLFLRGTVRSVVTNRRLDIDYGIEEFFVPEGEGQRFEEARFRHNLFAVLSVSPHGVPHLKRLEIRGEQQEPGEP